MTEGLLQTVLFGYGGLLLAVDRGDADSGRSLLRSRAGHGDSRPLVAQGSADRGLLLVFAHLARAGLDRLAIVDAPVSAAAGELSGRRIRFIPDRRSGGLECARRAVSALDFRRTDRRLAARARPIPTRRFECEILAWLGDSLEMQHRKLAALKQRPDMVIIYSGHNEFAARYEEERDGWLDPEPGNRLLQPIYRASLISPFCRLAYEIISKNRLDEPPPLSGRHQLIDPPQCSPAEAEAIRVDFEGRLEALTAYCERIGAVPVLIIPPANEADYEPSRSTLPAAVSQQERATLGARFRRGARARSARSGRKRASATRRSSIAIRALPRRTIGWPAYSSARATIEPPRDHYQAALDHDGLPIRCPAPLRAAYRSRGRSGIPSSILIDGRRELAAAEPPEAARRSRDSGHASSDAARPGRPGRGRAA